MPFPFPSREEFVSSQLLRDLIVKLPQEEQQLLLSRIHLFAREKYLYLSLRDQKKLIFDDSIRKQVSSAQAKRIRGKLQTALKAIREARREYGPYGAVIHQSLD